MPSTRRSFLRNASAAVGAAVLTNSLAAQETKPPTPAAPPAPEPTANPAAATTQANSKPNIAVIGCGGITRYHAKTLPRHANIVALADVDTSHTASYNKDHCAGKAFEAKDYRAVLDRSDVDMVLIGTPDHWHAKIAADALRAGKDVYCEKPLTLTIDEGRILCRIARETGRTFQIGTQQRSDERFLTAVALCHAGRLGKIRHVTVAVGDTPRGTEFPTATPPSELDWDLWLGQCPKVPYIKERGHYTFRWWYEYSGGRMTDWGAHHVDIGQWAAAPDLPGPSLVEPIYAELPVRFERGYPVAANVYNTASRFNVRCAFANGVDLFIKDRAEGFPADNGILIEGTGGNLFVNRQQLTGTAVDAMKDAPLPEGFVPQLPKADGPHERHQINFITAAKTKTTPASDVFSHHKHLTTCHLANIAMRLNRPLRWDASAQQILSDAEADTFQSRQQRRGYELV